MNRLLYQLSYAAMWVKPVSAPPKLSLVIISRCAEKVKHYFKIFSKIFGKTFPEVKALEIIKKTAMGCIGGGMYVGLELLWRGHSHISMFAAGGVCFLLLGRLARAPLAVRLLLGPMVITMVELAVGLLVNRDYAVWDYRAVPGNFLGQICPTYTALWLPLSLAAMALYPRLEKLLTKQR